MPFWQGRRIFVTGAGGFIASHLVEALVERQARVRAFVHYNSRSDPGLLACLSPDHVASLEIIAGDLNDSHAVSKAMKGCEIVMHLGALISIPYSYLHPVEVVNTNLIGTLNVLQAAREYQPARLVHTSTSEVYGSALCAPISEDHPLQGQSPYSASKIGADKLAESFYRTFDLPVVTLRPFNTYGPRQSARAVIPTIVSQALANDVIHLGNLEARRDLTYVSDIVAGFLRAAEVVGIEGETINLGSGSEIRIGDLAQLIISLIGHPAEIVVDPDRLRPEKSEVERLLSDYSKAHQRLGWSPQVDLTEGLLLTIEWIKAHPEYYRPGSYQI